MSEREGLHDKIASAIDQVNQGRGAYLKCDECGRRQTIDRDGYSNNLQHGWPKCCGYTMRLVLIGREQYA